MKTIKEECPGCEEEKCQDCCEHNEHDHFICLDCGKELDPGEFIDAAELAYGGDR